MSNGGCWPGDQPAHAEDWQRGCSQLEPHGSDIETYRRERVRRGELLINSGKSRDRSEQSCAGMQPRLKGKEVSLGGLELTLRFLNHSEIRNQRAKLLC